MTDFTKTDLYRKAAERISQEGMWCQGTYWPHYPLEVGDNAIWREEVEKAAKAQVPACLLGTLSIVAYELTGKGDALNYSDIADDLELGTTYAHHWNDQPERTADEVADRLRAAADRLL